MEKKILHLMTQDDQPYGSERKCCERCGYAYWKWGEDAAFVEDTGLYTEKVARRHGYTRCCDVPEDQKIPMKQEMKND